jgi:hypothetical protein
MKGNSHWILRGISCLCLLVLALAVAACGAPSQANVTARPMGFRFLVTDLGIKPQPATSSGTHPAASPLQAHTLTSTHLPSAVGQASQPRQGLVPAPLVALPQAINHYGQVLAAYIW